MIKLGDEEKITAGLLLAEAFLYVNMSPEIATFMFIFTIVYYIGVGSKRYPEVQIWNNRSDIFQSVLIGTIWVGIWGVIGYFILHYLYPEIATPSWNSVFRFMNINSEIPVLSSDPTIRFLVFGVLIPIVESLFFLSFGMEFFAKMLNIPIRWNPRDIRTWWLIALVGASASLFHLTSHMASDSALFMDFLFFSLSAWLVLQRKQLLDAIICHILTNSIILWMVMS